MPHQHIGGGIGFGLQRLEAFDQLGFLGHELRGQIGLPVAVNVFARVFHGLEPLRRGHGTVAHLVRGVHHVDGIHVRHHLDLLERHHPVVVHRLEPRVGLPHAKQPRPSHQQHQQTQGGQQPGKAGGYLELAHGRSPG